jgi:hypothetical protein
MFRNVGIQNSDAGGITQKKAHNNKLNTFVLEEVDPCDICHILLWDHDQYLC